MRTSFSVSRFVARVAVPLGLLAALCLSPSPAAAKTKLAVDAGADFPSGTGNDGGWGAGIRFGHEYRLTLLTLTPELGFRYHSFGGPADTTTFAFLGGGRVGIDFGLEPSVFAHAGLGHVETASNANTSLAYDVGAALDLTILPVISFGPHVMLAGVASGGGMDELSWLEIGGHVSFSWGE